MGWPSGFLQMKDLLINYDSIDGAETLFLDREISREINSHADVQESVDTTTQKLVENMDVLQRENINGIV